VGTAFLLMFVLALTDERNQPPKSNLAPLLIGFAVAAIGMSFGANAGYAINPARDFGPRLFAWLAGWGKVAFPGVHGYFWVPIVGPFIGGVLGAVVYDLFVGDVLRARKEPPAPDVEGFGETVEERPTTADDGQVEARGRTVRER
jgi:glycerol uptake facilitator protein